jgi:large subunit ribosomal protein L23
MQKVVQDKPKAKRPAPRRWFRPRSIKKMMVEMDQPFVWPKEPEDFNEYVLSSASIQGIWRGWNCGRA